MELSTTVLMVIFIFTFIPLVLAEVARTKSLPTLSDFFLQRRSMPAFMVFFTVYSTWVSSFAFLGSASYFYSKGPLYTTAIPWNLLFGLLFMVIGRRIWYYGKIHNYITPTDFFDDIYRSPLLNVIVTGIIIVFTIPYLMIQLSGGAFLIETASFGMIPWRVSGLIFYLIIIIYLWAGGLRAVALTDIYYGILIFTSMLVTGIFLAHKAGGVYHIFETLKFESPETLILAHVQGIDPSIMWFCMFLIVPIGALMGPQMWIRMYAPGKESTFKVMPLLIIICTSMYFGSILTGTAGKVLIPDLENADNLVPLLLSQYAPPVLAAILLCGIAAAALSTANSQIHALAAIYTMDVHKRYINPKAPERTLVTIGKWSVIGISFIAYILLLKSPSLIVETGTIGMSGTAQLLIPCLGALFWKRSNPLACSLSLLIGALTLVLLLIFSPLPVVVAAVLALLVNGITFICASMLLPVDMDTKERIINYRIKYEDRHSLK